jgi:hypothetical protein
MSAFSNFHGYVNEQFGFLNSVDLRSRRADSSENANAFPSCVGKFEDAIQCPAGSAGQVRPRRSLRRGGSPLAPLKAKRLERKSTTPITKLKS